MSRVRTRRPRSTPHLRPAAALAAVALVVGLVGATATAAGAGARRSGSVTVHLGYFDNVTHAPALVGLEGGIFAKKLGRNVALSTTVFNAGPAAVEALFSGAIDIAYVGPNPAVNAFAQSHGQASRIVSGAASGGASLVVKPTIKKASDLKGKTIATPQLGNTQDVALRTWLKSKALKTDTSGGGDVSIRPQDNAVTLTAFEQGQVQGAWVPEPWATRLVDEGGGKVLVDEADLWPRGQFATTVVIARKTFLDEHPDVVKRFLAANVAAIDFIHTNRAEAEKLVAQRILKDTTKPIAANLVTASFDHITFTPDPIASSITKDVKNAEAVGVLEATDVKGIFDLKLLNQVLRADNQSAVKSA
ncbi:MAG TPA: ABC transporter substrate-binding protein [Acidimicrobiia bacterium]|nr:ABC transporter substrate-binding protein [Acidimicrobiia bacterium]